MMNKRDIKGKVIKKGDVVIIYHWYLWTEPDSLGFHGKLGIINTVNKKLDPSPFAYRKHDLEIETNIYDEAPEIFYIDINREVTTCGKPDAFEVEIIGKL